MTYEFVHSATTWLSLSLTPLTIFACLSVCYLFFPAFMEHLKETKNHRLMTGTAFMILGIFVGFVGDFFDNFWWGIAWDRFYHDSVDAKFWFDNGVFSNVLFRQTSTLLAGSLHVYGAFIVARELETKHHCSRARNGLKILKIGFLISIAYAFYLWK